MKSLRNDFAALLPRVYELSEFLIDRLGVEDVGASFPHRVTYHASCHGLRALHLGDRPFRLLAKSSRSRPTCRLRTSTAAAASAEPFR